MAVKMYKFDSISHIYACGGFRDDPSTYAAVWTIDPSNGQLTRIAYKTTSNLYFKDLTFSEDNGVHFIYTILNQ